MPRPPRPPPPVKPGVCNPEGLTSVIIPTGGHMYLPRLRTCLNSIWSQRVKPLEVIVTYIYPRGHIVPDLSEFEEQGCRIIRYAHDEPDFPPSLSRNVGLKTSRGKIAMTVDADAVIDVRTIGVCERLIANRRAFVRIRTRMVGYNAHSIVFRRLHPQDFVREAARWKWAPGPGCVVVAPMVTIRHLRGWDERFVGYGPAVLDWVARLKQTGLKEIVLPDSQRKLFISCMHQNHRRVRDQKMTRLRRQNIKRYEQTLKGGNPIRNPDGWGRRTKE